MPTCAACGAEIPVSARFCPSCGAAVGERPATEERKLATILFADLVGSTALGEQDPERTRALLDRFYDAMAAEIESAGGTVEKFIGDAVVAAFGAPLAYEDHAERALHSALSMQRRLAELFGDKLALRIGVNTGDVVVGRPREGSSFVTGDAVNVAQRLEAAAAAGEVLAGERTVAAARGAFEFAEPETVEAKGKPGGIEGRRVVRALSLMRPRGVRDLRRVFVGRERDLDQLLATYRRVAERAEPHLLTIVGDGGVGKTRLVRELWERLGEEQPEPVRRTGRCISYGNGITYWPLGEVLKEHLGILESDPPEVMREALGAAREILGLALGLDVAPDLHPLAARDRLHDTWVEFLEEMARERPAVLLIEDLHWAEQELLELLERIVRDVDAPILVLGTTRPELFDERPGWSSARRGSSALFLEPLTAADSVRMIEELLAAEVPAALRDVVVGRAEGNPFFVEGLIATLLDSGLLERADGRWELRELPADFSVPDSVQAVLAARIDLLQPAEKAALQAASVIGRIFWTGPVYELLEGLEPDLRILEERDFIRRRPASSMADEREYAIKHALTREVAYASVPRARRARLHARFAGWLERFSEGRDEQAAFLGHHYAEAVRPEDADLAWASEPSELERLRGKAVFWLKRAAELAIGRYELDEGISLSERALALDPAPDEQAAIWRQIGVAHALRYDGDPLLEAMQRSLELSTDAVTRADTYADLAIQTATRAGMWRTRPESELVNGWIEQALDLAEPESPARAKALIARAFWARRDTRQEAREASALADRLGNLQLRSQALAARSIAAFAEGDFEESLMWAQRQLEMIPEISDPDHISDAYEIAIPPCCVTGQLREARRLAALHWQVCDGLTPHHRVHGVAVALEVEEICGGWETILESAATTEEIVNANLDTPCIRNARALLVTALAAALLGDEERARTLEERANEVETRGYEPVLSAPRIRLALLRGDLEHLDTMAPPFPEYRAQTWFALQAVTARLEALAALGDRERVEREAPLLAKPKTYLEPFAIRALGQVRSDEHLVEQAAARFDELGLAWHAKQTRALLAA
jgi:class 3 adenylate cyclase/tetratricopeptide (TPR) repeat protein